MVQHDWKCFIASIFGSLPLPRCTALIIYLSDICFCLFELSESAGRTCIAKLVNKRLHVNEQSIKSESQSANKQKLVNIMTYEVQIRHLSFSDYLSTLPSVSQYI